LIDKRRHSLDLSTGGTLLLSWYIRYNPMRNPDKWEPGERQPPPAPKPRRSALVGLLLIVCLIVGGLILTHVLGAAARLQDCALSGRSNCSADP